jgi:hypothetical protein
LQFYRIELVHLAPNSITIIATFIHLCEAFLGITPHFHLWRHFFELKKTDKGVVVGSINFMLHRNMKQEYWHSPTTPSAGSRGGSSSTTLRRH